MSHMFTYNWEENKNNWIYEEIHCVICNEKTKRILNGGVKKASKVTCGKHSCTNDTCQKCGIKEDDLNVHHCIPFKYFQNPNYANSIENLIPLCKKCHIEVHKENHIWYETNFREMKI